MLTFLDFLRLFVKRCTYISMNGQFVFFSVVTQSTTGYGNILPTSPISQFVTSVHMLISIVYVCRHLVDRVHFPPHAPVLFTIIVCLIHSYTTVIFGVGMSHYYNFHNDPDFERVTRAEGRFAVTTGDPMICIISASGSRHQYQLICV